MKTVVLLAILAVGAAAQATRTNPLAGDPRAVEEGRVAFRGSCSLCHGIKGEGGRGPDLTIGAYTGDSADKTLYDIISSGVAGTEMPGFASRFESDDIWRLVTYVRSIASSGSGRTTGNIRNGDQLFWNKGQCGQCHMVDGRGMRMGPDLSAVGRQRSAAYLHESIVSPGADLTPGYTTITVVTKEGRRIVGTRRAYDDFSVQLMDRSEAYYSFQKSDVTSIQQDYTSLMPNTYGRLFNATELADLVAYLTSLRGTRR
jgi:putative heme-binding domain-containing protein